MRCRTALAALAFVVVLLHCGSPPAPSRPRPVVLPSGPEFAQRITVPALINGQLCGPYHRGEEWYRFTLLSPGTLTVDLHGSSGGADVDLDVFRNTPGHSIGRSASTGNDEHITQNVAPDDYWVRVQCFGGGATVAYWLELRFMPQPPPPPPPPPALDEAKALGTEVEHSAHSAIGVGARYQSRWYKYRVRHKGTITVTFQPDVKNGSLAFAIVDERGHTLNQVRSSMRNRTVTADVVPYAVFFRVSCTNPATRGEFGFRVQFAPQQTPLPVVVQPQPPIASKPQPRPQPPAKPKASPPPEPLRSQAKGLSPGTPAFVAVGGSTYPPSDWFTFSLDTESSVRLEFTGRGHVTIAIYPRGSGSPMNVEKNTIYGRGVYDVHVAGRPEASGNLHLHVAKKDPNAGFTRRR